MSELPENLLTFKVVFSCENGQNSVSLSLSHTHTHTHARTHTCGKCVGWSDFVINLYCSKARRHCAGHEKGHCHDARCKYQAKVQILPDEQPHNLAIISSNSVDLLSDIVKEI